MSASRCCPHCHCRFTPSIYRPQQLVCSQPECQRWRRAEYHRKKLQADPVYCQVVRESQRQWWDEHADYQTQRRQKKPAVVVANRQRQRQRDQKRRLQHLVRNNLAFDLKRASAGVWLVGRDWDGLDRNNLASAEVLIFQPVSSATPNPTAS